jgi:hypothetical protein
MAVLVLDLVDGLGELLLLTFGESGHLELVDSQMNLTIFIPFIIIVVGLRAMFMVRLL